MTEMAHEGWGSNGPRVACLMPTTRKRRAFWPLAIRNFERQTYGNARLFIGLDGEGFGPFVGDAGRIRHFDCATLGDKWNALHAWAIEEGAEWFAAWPDDDWQHPETI